MKSWNIKNWNKIYNIIFEFFYVTVVNQILTEILEQHPMLFLHLTTYTYSLVKKLPDFLKLLLNQTPRGHGKRTY